MAFRIAALSALAASVSGEGLTYLWNQNNLWSNTGNWNGNDFNGLVDLSQDCVNQFNSDDKAGMALGLDTDATAGTLRLPVAGKIVLGRKVNGEAASLTLTGGSAPSNSWNCRPRVATSSSCSSNYRVFNGTTEITTSKPPCWEDTVVVDLDAVSSMTWHPGHVIKELKVTRGYQTPAAEGTMVAKWPAPNVENALRYDAWDSTVMSRIAGASPSISECPNADCQIYCFNSCPAADITDLNIAEAFGSEGSVTEEDINAALDSASQARAAIGRTKNALSAALSAPGRYLFDVGYVVDEVLQEDGFGITPAGLLSRVENEGWVKGIFMGWSVLVVEGVLSIRRDIETSNIDYNIAWMQAKHAIRYVSQLDGQQETPVISVTAVGGGPVKATSAAAAQMLAGDARNIPSTAAGGLSAESIWTRGRIATYLTNDRAQVTARYFRNASNDAVTASVWEAPDDFAANASNGFLLSAKAPSRRTAANAAGEDASSMIARVIEGANRLTTAAGPAAMIQDIATLTCGSYWPEDSTDRFAKGACVATDITLMPNSLYVTIPDDDDESATRATSLITPAIFESTLGLVITQMSMHAVSAMLNESIVRTDSAWTAFTTAPSAGEEENGFPMMIAIAGGAGCLLLLIIMVVIVSMSGGEKAEKSNRNVVAFENPMYDDPTNSGGNFDADDDGGLYDEPTFQAGNKQNPTYSSQDDVAESADPGMAGGYLDVEPDDGDDDDDDDDDEESESDDDEDE